MVGAAALASTYCGTASSPVQCQCSTCALPAPWRSTGGAWGFSSCTNADINGWADAANAVLKSQGVVNPDNYPYK